MDRAALEQVDREALIGIILRQQELIDRLAGEVAELKARAGQPPKTPGNSSVPPSMGLKLKSRLS
jgi:transposase